MPIPKDIDIQKVAPEVKKLTKKEKKKLMKKEKHTPRWLERDFMEKHPCYRDYPDHEKPVCSKNSDCELQGSCRARTKLLKQGKVL